MKTSQELNALRYRARHKSRRRIQAVYVLILATCTLIWVAIIMASPMPLLPAILTALAGLILAYRDERLEKEYRAAVYSQHDTPIKTKKTLN